MQNCNLCQTLVDTESKLGPAGDHVADATLYHSLDGFLESFREEKSPVEVMEEGQVPTPKKKLNRRCQTAPTKKPHNEKGKDQRCYAWTAEEQIIFQEVPEFKQEREEKKNKRYKSSDSSSFNTRESGEGSINLIAWLGTRKMKCGKFVEAVLLAKSKQRGKRNGVRPVHHSKEPGNDGVIADQKIGAGTQCCDNQQETIRLISGCCAKPFTVTSSLARQILHPLGEILGCLRSLASVSSLTTSKQPLTSNYHHITTYKAHTSSISSLTISGKHIFSGSSDHQIRVWPRDPNLASWNNLIAHAESCVKSMVVSGRQLFTGHQDNKIHVWNIDNQNLNSTRVATLPTLNDRFGKMFLAKNYVKVRRNKTCTWVHHVDAVTALALSRDGSLLYSASWDRTFKVWRTSDFKCLESVPNAHDDAINAIVVSR
ncbi:JINGUBANG-like protein [Tanacetum coccineum]